MIDEEKDVVDKKEKSLRIRSNTTQLRRLQPAFHAEFFRHGCLLLQPFICSSPCHGHILLFSSNTFSSDNTRNNIHHESKLNQNTPFRVTKQPTLNQSPHKHSELNVQMEPCCNSHRHDRQLKEPCPGKTYLWEH